MHRIRSKQRLDGGLQLQNAQPRRLPFFDFCSKSLAYSRWCLELLFGPGLRSSAGGLELQNTTGGEFRVYDYPPEHVLDRVPGALNPKPQTPKTPNP